MELVGIDFGTCNIKVVRRAGESYKNFRIDNTSNDLKKGTANKVFYRDNELLLGDKATKGRNRCKTVEEQNNYIEKYKRTFAGEKLEADACGWTDKNCRRCNRRYHAVYLSQIFGRTSGKH